MVSSADIIGKAIMASGGRIGNHKTPTYGAKPLAVPC
jgi:hypothetical protein